MVRGHGYKILTDGDGDGSVTHRVDGGKLAAVALGSHTDPSGEVDTPDIALVSEVRTKGEEPDDLEMAIWDGTVNLGDYENGFSGSVTVLDGSLTVQLSNGSADTEYTVTVWIHS